MNKSNAPYTKMNGNSKSSSDNLSTGIFDECMKKCTNVGTSGKMSINFYNNYKEDLNKEYMKNFIPQINLIALLMLIGGILKLLGVVESYKDCDCVGDGEKGSCIKFKKHKKPCTSTNCLLTSITAIIFALYILIMKIPYIKYKMSNNTSKWRLLVLLPYAIVLGIAIYLIVDNTKADKEQENKDKNDDNDESSPPKKDIPFLAWVFIIIIILCLIGAILNTIKCDKKKYSKTNCFIYGLGSPFRVFGKLLYYGFAGMT